jgi:hypothetical protein
LGSRWIIGLFQLPVFDPAQIRNIIPNIYASDSFRSFLAFTFRCLWIALLCQQQWLSLLEDKQNVAQGKDVDTLLQHC